MEQETNGVERLLSEPEVVAWLGLGPTDDQPAAPLWRVTVGTLPDAPSPEAA